MRGRVIDRGFVVLTAFAVLLITAMLTVVLGNIVWHGWEQITWEFLTAAPRQGMTEGGIFPAIYGTVLLVLLMTIFVVPLGVCVAIYFSEYANRESWLYRWTRQAVNNLAGVPSIVFGLFGLGFFVQFVGRRVDKALYDGTLTYGQPALVWAALTMAVLTLPVVIVSVEEALRAVPQSYRDASLALGATRSQTIFRVVLPQAMSGVLTGGILAVSRGAGEVAPILFVGAAYFLPHLPTRLNDQFMELGYHIYVLSTQSPNVEETKPLLYGTVLVLLVLTFLLNFTAIAIRARLRTGAARAR
ncbi:MAG TPA: phosphate ABC transporter permease PstA [Candidatus Acidoferrales bacterium]|nr:phosphate ABC transporter permease PstA [Candidatus Acidoferrales bacterium]